MPVVRLAVEVAILGLAFRDAACRALLRFELVDDHTSEHAQTAQRNRHGPALHPPPPSSSAQGIHSRTGLGRTRNASVMPPVERPGAIAANPKKSEQGRK